MPCKNAQTIIDTIYVNIYKKYFIFIYSIKKMQRIEKWPYYLFVAEFRKKKIERKETNI